MAVSRWVSRRALPPARVAEAAPVRGRWEISGGWRPGGCWHPRFPTAGRSQPLARRPALALAASSFFLRDPSARQPRARRPSHPPSAGLDRLAQPSRVGDAEWDVVARWWRGGPCRPAAFFYFVGRKKRTRTEVVPPTRPGGTVGAFHHPLNPRKPSLGVWLAHQWVWWAGCGRQPAQAARLEGGPSFNGPRLLALALWPRPVRERRRVGASPHGSHRFVAPMASTTLQLRRA